MYISYELHYLYLCPGEGGTGLRWIVLIFLPRGFELRSQEHVN